MNTATSPVCKENIVPRALFPDVITAKKDPSESLKNCQQEFVERGFFKTLEGTPEEAKVSNMDVDESSCSSDEIRGEHEEEKSSKCDQEMASSPSKNLEGIDAAILRDIAGGLDCFIGDEELLVSKKALTSRQTPMALVAQLSAKLP